ncbi:MAG: hypothetical protein HOE90_22315 [Bacteriovoracaceae bacterium]|jgi:hypothetical protein|nr:hypothetical protein [Bacteriovoracaceae bacterium]
MRLLLYVLVVLPTMAFSGDRIRNGGGIAEQNVLTAYWNLDQYIKICTQNEKTCKTTDKEKALLGKIRKNLELEYSANKNEEGEKKETQIIFTTAKKEKDASFFTIGGEVKIAKTGDYAADPIYFNTDLMYSKNDEGLVEPISISDSLAILVHEMGHHHDVLDHTYLSLVGAKVSAMLQKRMEEARLFPHSDAIKAVVINEKNTKSFPSFLIFVQDQVLDISKEIKDELKCSGAIPKEFSSKRPQGANVFNLSWDIKNVKKIKKKKIRFTLKGNLALFCKKDAEIDKYQKEHNLRVEFKVRLVTKKDSKGEKIRSWELVEDSIDVDQVFDPWWFIIRIPNLGNLFTGQL